MSHLDDVETHIDVVPGDVAVVPRPHVALEGPLKVATLVQEVAQVVQALCKHRQEVHRRTDGSS